jgi:threonine dehydrogenase-like Zn-dependent dehydrogenase
MKADEILLRVRACGICGPDLSMYRLGMFAALGRPMTNGVVLIP